MAIKFLNSTDTDSGVLYVDATNNRVGVGTASPANTLSINSADSQWDVATWKVNNGKTGTLYADTAGVGFYVGTSAFSTYVGSYFSEAEKSWDVRTNGTVRIKITSSGNVGIGTTSPGYKLTVAGSIQISENAKYYYNKLTGGGNVRMLGINNSDVAYVGPIDAGPVTTHFNASSTSSAAYFYTAGSIKMSIASNGNVGIGTTSPSYKLDVAGDASVYDSFVIRQTSNAASVADLYADFTKLLITAGGSTGANHYLALQTQDNYTKYERMRITADGNVGIGTTSPSQSKLVVDGDISIPRGNALVFLESITGSFRAKITSQNTFPVFNGLEFYTGADGTTPKMVISDSGNLQLHSYGAGVLTTDADGNITASTAYQTQATADSRYLNTSGDTATGLLILNPSVQGAGLKFSQVSDGGSHYQPTEGGSATDRYWLRFDHTNNASYPYLTNRTPSGAVVIKTGTAAGGAENEHFRIKGGDGVVDAYFTNANVGIGTTSPAYKLDVSGDIRSTAAVRANTNLIVGGYTDISGYVNHRSDFRVVNKAQNSWLTWAFRDTTGTEVLMDLSNIGSINASGALTFSNYGAGVLTTDSAGNVTASTAYQTQATADGRYVNVTGDTMSGNLTVSKNNPTISFNDEGLVMSMSYDGGVFYIDPVSGANRTVRITNSGTGTNNFIVDDNVGIGTTSPEGKLHIYQPSGAGPFLVTRGTDKTGVNFQVSVDSSKVRLNGYGDALTFFTAAVGSGTNASERMRITSDGNVGIGTASPNAQLHVYSTGNGELEVERASGALFNVQAQASLASIGTDSNHPLYLKTNAGTRVAITTGGNVGIGTTAPAQKLHVEGSVLIDAFNAGNETGIFFREGFYNYNVSILAYDHSGAGTTPDGISINGYDGVSFSTGSNTRNERMRITQSGNVGIGTTSPNEELEVKSASFSTVAVNTDRNTSGENIGSFAFYGHNNATTPENLLYSRIMSSMTDATDGSENSDIFFQQINDGTIQETFRAKSSGEIQFPQYGAGYLRTDADGNVIVDISTVEDTLDSVTNRGSTTSNSVAFGTTTKQANTTLTVQGPIDAGGKTTYTKIYGSLDTIGNAVAGLSTGSNGNSAMFTFTMYGAGEYQKIVYSCWNTSGTAWKVKKVIDEGTNAFDITVDVEAATRNFTFVTRSGSQNYSPTVVIEHIGYSLDTSYLA